MKETPMQEEFDMEKELQQEFIQELAEFFKIFGDATRIRILQTLLEGERNVGDLADVLEMSQSAVSHQLRVLRQNDLVKYRKEGKTVFYSLDDEHIRMVLEQGIIEGRKTYANMIKYIKMTASSNFGNMFSVLAASVLVSAVSAVSVVSVVVAAVSPVVVGVCSASFVELDAQAAMLNTMTMAKNNATYFFILSSIIFILF